jgi:V/A-type H+-transporting ATPase subunit I
MFKPVEMCKVNVLVLNKHLMDTTRKLGSKGSVHLVDAIKQSQSHLLNSLDDQKDQNALGQLLDKAELLIRKLGVDEDAEVPNVADMNQEDIAALLDKIFFRYKEQDNAINKLVNDANNLTRDSARLAGFPIQKVSLDVLHSLSHFYMVTGRLSPSVIPSAISILGDRGLLVQADGKEGNVLVMASRKNRWAVEEELNKLGFKAVEEPEGVNRSVSEERQVLEDSLLNLKQELEECRLNVLKLGECYGGVLLAMRTQLRGLVAVHKARKHFGQLSQLACISGWTPKDQVDEIKRIVDETTDGTGIVEVIDAEDDALVKAGLETVPVKFTDGPLRRPFHMLISNFGMPRYNELDPTLFVGLTFVILFGFMFGDVGQGAVLFAAGMYMKFTKRKLNDSLRDAGMLLAACGLSSVLFGFGYGSIFGYENEDFLPHLWVSPLHGGIERLLISAVGVGIVFSSMAIIINIINHFLAKHYFEGIFDKYGLLGLLFYWTALGVGLWLMLSKDHTVKSWHVVLLATPLVLLFIREPLHNFLQKKRLFHGTSVFSTVLEGIIETMETLTGYLSGTVSFVRVGAFAISHAALSMAVFLIVGMLDNLPGGFLWKTLVIIVGNIIIIAFEGMVAMIQGLRLEYYELFGKFFSGSGVAYKPFDLKNDK